ncbi:MAG: ribonuclease HII [Vicinamibacterales bacterium]|nr:ribonuclease HII [Vicinamibacterales bacterium]
MRRTGARRTIENTLRRFGFVYVAGVDEVGRGCLAGPVIAGAVILDPGRHIPGLADSKLLTPVRRDDLAERIRSACLAWAVAGVEPADIDRINIHRASLEAMRRAVVSLVPLPDALLVDAFRIPGVPMAQRGIVQGDRRCAAVAAASIVAKVHRDRLMLDLHACDPRYGFDRHKGYATPDHLAALARHGYSPAHRRSFRPASLFDTMTGENIGDTT